jgi:hypothetical protein
MTDGKYKEAIEAVKLLATYKGMIGKESSYNNSGPTLFLQQSNHYTGIDTTAQEADILRFKTILSNTINDKFHKGATEDLGIIDIPVAVDGNNDG